MNMYTDALEGLKDDVKFARTAPKQLSLMADKFNVQWLDAEKLTMKGKPLSSGGGSGNVMDVIAGNFKLQMFDWLILLAIV